MMNTFRRIILVSTLVCLWLGTATAQRAVDSIPYTYGIEGAVSFAPLTITCTSWSAWITSVNYCQPDVQGLAGICTTLPLSEQFADQYRKRTCTNTMSGHQTIEYEFRTVRQGCCGGPIYPCW